MNGERTISNEKINEKIIVAVHGVGDQIGYATAQSVAYQFCRYCGQPAAIPLGRFHGKFVAGGARGVPKPILITSPPSGPELPGLGFAEVYWADIPRAVVKDGYVLEEAKRWARTIVGRYCLQSKLQSKTDVPSEEVTRLETVLDEMIETVFVLERVTWLADRAGLFKFNLRKLLEDYLGDVQLVADFETYRGKILEQFDEVMRKALELSKSGQAELYLVAHSEGSVIAFLGILTAWSQPGNYKWVKSIRGLMTIGSPIETHHLLWPDLWQTVGAEAKGLRPSAPPPPKDKRIKWWNYLDSADPIAYRLDKTREWLNKAPAEEGAPRWSDYFDFGNIEKPQETEFCRYYFPGKAHIDYWDDAEVFGHFIQNVVRVPPGPKPSDESAPSDFSNPPEDRWSAMVASRTFPYLLVAVLLFAALFALYNPVAAVLLIEPSALTVLRDVGGLALLLLGLISAVRIPRLTKDRGWRVRSWLILGAAMVAYPFVVLEDTRQGLGAIFGEYSHTFGLLGTLFAVAVVSSLLARKRPKWGVRILPLAGVLLAAVLVWRLLYVPVGDKPDVWPVLLGAAGFFYLWWLAALLFDLTFVWHHYVCSGAIAHHLRETCDASPGKPGGDGAGRLWSVLSAGRDGV
jgi:hypothetical protein